MATSEIVVFDTKLKEEREYWINKLGQQVGTSNIPSDYERGPHDTGRRSFIEFDLPAPLPHLLGKLTGNSPFLAYTALMAALKVCLHKYTGRSAIVVGSPSLKEVNGHQPKANAHAIVDEVSGQMLFKTLLMEIRQTLLDAYSRTRYPFSRLLKDLGLREMENNCPLFDMALASEELHQGMPAAHHDITVVARPAAGAISGFVEYKADLFQPETIERFIGHFINILSQGLEAPNRPIRQFDLLTEPERRTILFEWNRTGGGDGRDRCFHQLFEAIVEKTPDAVAAVYGFSRLTYRELNSRTNRLAHHLRALGVGPEATVGVCMERSFEMLIALTAVLKSGGAYVPLDPAYPPERLAFMLRDSQIAVLLTQDAVTTQLPEQRALTVRLDRDWHAIEQSSELNPVRTAGPDNLAYVIYTSGSTGQPKGAMITQRGLTNYLNWAAGAYPVTEGEGSPVHSSISFDLTVTALFPSLLAGKSVFLLPQDYGVVALNTAIKDGTRFSLIKITPSHLEVLGQQLSSDRAILHTGALIIGGEQLRYESLGVWRELAPGARLINEYGPTETVVGCCVCEVSDRAPESGPAPIGRPIAGTQLYLLDTDLQPVPVTVSAELFIGGRGVARGYLNRPDVTAEKFVPDLFGEARGARLYRTGDVARYLPGGELEFIGRGDGQVKIRGYRIEPGEIEALLNLYPGVRESVVLAQQDAWSKSRLVAYIAAGKDGEPDAAELKSYLKRKLPEYMVPAGIVIAREFPLTPNGKIDRAALPSLELQLSRREDSAQAARTPVEEVLMGLFMSVLGVERINRDDDFFELGGHSLLATRLMIRLREIFHLNLPMRVLFEAPTVAVLARRVETAIRAGQTTVDSPVESVAADVMPLSFAQQRLWFLDQLEPGSAVYNTFSGLRLKGPLNPGKLEESLNAVIKRHQILRTKFAIQDGRPVQVVVPDLALAFKIDDLRDIGPGAAEAEIERLAAEEAAAPFDLSTGPLLRATALKFSEEDHAVLFTMHHIINDAWSVGILIREVTLLYDSFVREEPSPLPELPYQYFDYTRWQHRLFQSGQMEEQLAYWKSRLGGELPALELPADFPRPGVQTFNGAREHFELPVETVAALRTLGRHEGATLFMTLLAAFKVLLYRYSGIEDVIVGVPIANRSRSEFEGLIGFFVNTLVMRTGLSGRPTFRELIGRVRETALGAYAHQDLPFEELVQDLRPQRDLSRHPLFQVMFTLQNVAWPRFELSGLSASLLEIEFKVTQFDLTLESRESGHQLRSFFEYNTALFAPDRIKRLVEHFQALVAAIVSNPDRRLDEIPILTQAERLQLLEDRETSLPAIDDERCLHHLFEVRAEERPDALAVISEEAQMSYRELDFESNRLARYLRRLGVGPEDVVGVLMKPSAKICVALLGALKAGAAYLTLDPDFPAESTARMLTEAKAEVLLVDESSRAAAREYDAHAVCVDDEAVSREAMERLETDIAGDHAAYVVFGSDSTGELKGTLVTRRGLVNHAREISARYGLQPEDRILQCASPSLDVLAEEIFPAWACGASVVFMPQGRTVSSTGFQALLEEHRITVMNLSADARRAWAPAGFKPPSALRRIVVGTELPPAYKFFSRIERSGRPVQLTIAYRVSEATITSAANDQFNPGRIDHPQLRHPQLRHPQLTPIGHALKNTRAVCLDENLQAVPIGVTGDLYLGGAGLARGYLNRPELTAECFIPDPFSREPGARMYRTGDLARNSLDLSLIYLGRKERQARIKGFRIEPDEIEAVLSTHPMVEEAVAMVRETSSGDRFIAAFVVPAPESGGADIDLHKFGESLKAQVRNRLPEYLIPSVILPIEALPLTPAWKIDYNALAGLSDSRSQPLPRDAAPRTEIEHVIARVWREALGLEKIGVHDNFFDLGGHSLLLARVHLALKETFGDRLSIIRVFQFPTINSLAEHLAQERAQRQSPASTQDRANRQRAAGGKHKRMAEIRKSIKP